MVKPNILFIVVDTLREDSSEVLWKMLETKGFARYKNVISTSPWTTPSHASIFTGQYPSVHGAHTTNELKIDDVKLKSDDQLTHDLKSRGYRCHLLSANPYISDYYGFRGFDDQYEILYTPDLKLISHAEWDLISSYKTKGASPVTISKALIDQGRYSLLVRSFLQKMGLEFILNKLSKFYGTYIGGWPKEKGSRRILARFRKLARSLNRSREFIFINLMEAHEPYMWKRRMKYVYNFNKALYNKEINENILNRLRGAYDKELIYITRKIDRILGELERLDMLRDTLVMITSDHGQLFGEHGKLGHGVFLYDELLRVPMFIKYPNASKRIEIDPEGPHYISLLRMREFLVNSLDRDMFDEGILTSDHSISESHGINIRLKFKYDQELVEELDKLHLSVYHRNAQGIFNVSSWKFDLITSFDDKEVDDVTVSTMKNFLVAHIDHFSRIKLLKSRLDDPGRSSRGRTST